MTCNEIIQSENTMDLIVPLGNVQQIEIEPDCVQTVGSAYSIFYYERDKVAPMSISAYGYSVIPACFGLLDTTALEVSGISALQNQPALSLNGSGVLVGFLDTGIAYTSAAFCNSDKSTKIAAIWDQTGNPDTEGAQPPAGFYYGVEYRREKINRALAAEDPYSVVPQRDENGHGTLLAGIACGSKDAAAGFTGAAPESELLVVKLKPAKQPLKDFYYIPEGTLAYQEDDLMAAVAYLDGKARELEMPLVICIGLGTNQGSHAQSNALSVCLDEVGRVARRCVVIATGNEAAARHHFYGVSHRRGADSGQGSPQTSEAGDAVAVEINVEQTMPGFYLELWAGAPELLSVSIRSPGGQLFSSAGFWHQEYSFILENTTVEIDYYSGGKARGDQLVFVRFNNALRGIWTMYVHPVTTISGNFHAWLPMTGMLSGDVYFLKPDPDVTLTTPSSAQIPISVGGYDARDNALYLESGRGYTADGTVKPDFCAPAVEVQGVNLRGNAATGTGTSIAAAVTAGACAQILEWGVVRQNNIYMNSAEIGNMLIRGCRRDGERSYPNTQWGYGRLDVYSAFLGLH